MTTTGIQQTPRFKTRLASKFCSCQPGDSGGEHVNPNAQHAVRAIGKGGISVCSHPAAPRADRARFKCSRCVPMTAMRLLAFSAVHP